MSRLLHRCLLLVPAYDLFPVAYILAGEIITIIKHIILIFKVYTVMLWNVLFFQNGTPLAECQGV